MDRSKNRGGKGGKAHQPFVGSELIALGKTKPGTSTSLIDAEPKKSIPLSKSSSSAPKTSSSSSKTSSGKIYISMFRNQQMQLILLS